MNDRQLRSFLQAAEQKSFSKAADALYISTPALVQQINLLEAGVGFSLFVRTHRGVALTAAGEEFYRAAKEILHLYESACARGKALAQDEALTLRIACPPEQFPPFLLSAYENFCRDYPRAEVSFVTCLFSEVFPQLRSGAVDLALLAEPSPEWLSGFSFFPLCEDTYSFCLRPDHPLARRKRIRKGDLAGQKILCGSYPYMKIPFEEPLRACGALPETLEREYDMDIRTTSLLSDKVFVIHSLWGRIYEAFLTVLPSDISAGLVGALSRSKPPASVRLFLPYLRACTASS